jgi:hypothetical protein
MIARCPSCRAEVRHSSNFCSKCGQRLTSKIFSLEVPMTREEMKLTSIDHTCPVAWAAEHGLLDGSPVYPSWCLSAQRDNVLSHAYSQRMVQEIPLDLLLWQEGRISIYYAPWDWVNTAAKVMLVGITPGAYQAIEALREARRCLLAGMSNEETLRSADAVGAFSGPMRTNLVNMLDGIGVARALGIDTTARLFGSHHRLAAHVSAIDYPVFIDGKNYTGGSPSLVRHPVLRSLVVACLGARVAMVPNAVVIPLGEAAQKATELLIERGLLDRRRCLLGFPHPSGGNGWRVRYYKERQQHLTADVARLFIAR